MRILHTADWHLGRKIHDIDLLPIQKQFLQWLLQTLQDQQVEILIVAGDIFDTGTPSNEARKAYYDFLTKAQLTCCKNIVIVGGNHDSPSNLDAPRELLASLNIHVVGGTTQPIEDEIINIKDAQQNTRLVVLAVPFLREKDVQYATHISEERSKREQRVKDAIKAHYHTLSQIVTQRNYPTEVPLLATGHLFAQNSETSESEKDIYVGNLGQIGAEEFPENIDYVALGHLHRPQRVGGKEHVRYAGSPIALSFSEIKDKKQVLILDFDAQKKLQISPIEIPIFQKMVQIKGKSIEEVQNKMKEKLSTESKEEIWIDLQIQSETWLFKADQTLKEWAKTQNTQWRILRTMIKNTQGINPFAANHLHTQTLITLTEEDVFVKFCEKNAVSPDETNQMLPLITLLKNMNLEDL
ncbi:MAG: exonuclease subunit SbcD [Cytophagales bacterium]|nr:MAG: exonuclease subunit SbcD [Cytophagales bacterium]